MELRKFTSEDYKISKNCQPVADGNGPFIYHEVNKAGVEVTILVGSDEDIGSAASIGIQKEEDHRPNLTAYVIERSDDSEHLIQKVKDFFQQNESILASGSCEDIISKLDSMGLEKYFEV